jgi:hypothetical protein
MHAKRPLDRCRLNHWRPAAGEILLCAVLYMTLFMGANMAFAAEPNDKSSQGDFAVAATVVQARARAQLLHETIHGMLQVMHRDFFDEESQHAIPSASMEDVFHELERGFGVQVKWLNVHTDVLNVDHNPTTEFERAAAKVIAAGGELHEQTTADRYQYAGRIRLASQCLKCHVKNRLTADERSAGLAISMPLGERPVVK